MNDPIIELINHWFDEQPKDQEVEVELLTKGLDQTRQEISGEQSQK